MILTIHGESDGGLQGILLKSGCGMSLSVIGVGEHRLMIIDEHFGKQNKELCAYKKSQNTIIVNEWDMIISDFSPKAL